MAYKPFDVTQGHIDFLREKRIFHSAVGDAGGWLKVGSKYTPYGECEVEPYSSQRNPNHFNSMGAFTYCRSLFFGRATIGRYCSVGELVKVMSPSHPLDRVGTCGFDYAFSTPYDMLQKDRGITLKRTPLPPENYTSKATIGHDVWIGNEARLAPVNIGIGAVIAAYSVVTKDVEPYTLVAGNPARPKKRRFSDSICERLLASRWWEYAFTDFANMDTLHPERFLDQFGEAVASGAIKPYTPEKINLHREFERISASAVKASQEVKATQTAASVLSKMIGRFRSA